jgi:hypothetical protein
MAIINIVVILFDIILFLLKLCKICFEVTSAKNMEIINPIEIR